MMSRLDQFLNFDWQVLFNTVIHDFSAAVRIEVENEQILLHGPASDIAEINSQLAMRLVDAPAFFSGLPYRVTLPESSGRRFSVVELQEIAPPAADDYQAAVNILRNLFVNQAGDLGLTLDLVNMFARDKAIVHQGVIFSRSTDRESVAKAWQANLEALLEYFSGVGLNNLREVYLSGAKIQDLQSAANLQDKKVVAALGLLKECFGVQKTEQEWRLYCGFRRLHNLLFPPQLQLNVDENQTATLIIPRAHFIHYFRQISDGGILLRVFREHEMVQARPIVITSSEIIARPKHFTLLIDCSGSLESVFPQLQSRLKDFIAALRSRYSAESLVRLAFFNSELKVKQAQLGAETAESQYQLERFIDSVQAEGRTRLYGALKNQMQHLYADELFQTHHCVMVVFTDGQNNEKPMSADVLDAPIAQFGVDKPLVFTLGAGNEYDAAILSDLTRQVGGEHYHIDTMTHFDVLTHQIPAMEHARRFIEMIITAQKEQTATVLVSLNDAPHVTQVLVPFTTDSITLATPETGSLQFEYTDSVPAMTAIDRVLQLRDRAYDVVEDVVAQRADNAQAQRRIVQLQQELEEKANDPASAHVSEFLDHLGQQLADIQMRLRQADTLASTRALVAMLSQRPAQGRVSSQENSESTSYNPSRA